MSNDSISERGQLLKENEELRVKLEILNSKAEEKEKTIDNLIEEKGAYKEANQISVLKEQELKTQIETWQRVVDELAHTIHTDIFIATESLFELEENKHTKKIYAHLTEIRDLTDLTLWFLRKNELYKKDDRIVSIDLRDIIEKQINSIKEAPSTLRLSTELHRENLNNLKVVIEVDGSSNVEISDEIRKVFNLLFKDLLRNAFKNTEQENPIVSVKLIEESQVVKVSISNNKLMPDNFSKWLTTETLDEPEISKHSKAGLRILKKWINYLDIRMDINTDQGASLTEIVLSIPKIITLKES